MGCHPNIIPMAMAYNISKSHCDFDISQQTEKYEERNKKKNENADKQQQKLNPTRIVWISIKFTATIYGIVSIWAMDFVLRVSERVQT